MGDILAKVSITTAEHSIPSGGSFRRAAGLYAQGMWQPNVMDMRVDQPKGDSGTPDEALLIRFGNGDLEAARLLTERLGPRVLSYATRLLGGDRAEAEDVTQEAMLRLWQFAPNWQQGRAQVMTWLYRVVGNLCVDRLRKARADALDESEVLATEPSVVQQMQNRDRLRALYWALAKLPDRQRQAVILRHIEGLSNPRVAEVMEISVEAVESLTARGKRGLAAHLTDRKEELGFDDGA